MSPRIKTIVGWTLRVVLAIFFTLAALPKLLAAEAWSVRFLAWGYPIWFMYLTGLLELSLAIGLLLTRTARIASIGLGVVMVGAGVTHGMASEWDRLPVNVGYIAALLLVWWLLKPAAAPDQKS